MFYCQECGTLQAAGSKPVTLITKRRSKEYGWRGKLIGNGWEIAEEKKVCAPCGTGPLENDVVRLETAQAAITRIAVG